MKNKKGIGLIMLIIITAVVIVALILLFSGGSNNSAPSSSVSKPSTSITKEDRSTYTAKCKTINYKSLARKPNQYKGQYFVFTGEVIQVMEDNNKVTLRVNVTPKRYESLNETYYEDTILVAYEYSSSNENRILEDDIITIYGQSTGTYTYETVMGSAVTIPAINAMYIDIK